MFPEITRDEVFRIETMHLWLRWPVFADAEALAHIVDQDCHEPRAPETQPERLRTAIVRWRAEMEAGSALHLMLAPKGGGPAIGIVHAAPEAALRCRLASGEGTRPLGAEAVEATRTMMKWLGVTPALRDRSMAQQRGLFLRAEFAGWCAQA